MGILVAIFVSFWSLLSVEVPCFCFQSVALLSAVFLFSHSENIRTRQNSFRRKAWPKKIAKSINFICGKGKRHGNWLLFRCNLERSRKPGKGSGEGGVSLFKTRIEITVFYFLVVVRRCMIDINRSGR